MNPNKRRKYLRRKKKRRELKGNRKKEIKRHTGIKNAIYRSNDSVCEPLLGLDQRGKRKIRERGKIS